MKLEFALNGKPFARAAFEGEAPDSFWDDFLGGDEEDSELSWRSDVSQNGDTIRVDWFAMPTDPPTVIASLSKGLQKTLLPYEQWEHLEEKKT